MKRLVRRAQLLRTTWGNTMAYLASNEIPSNEVASNIVEDVHNGWRERRDILLKQVAEHEDILVGLHRNIDTYEAALNCELYKQEKAVASH